MGVTMEAKSEESRMSNCYCEFGITDWEDHSKAFKTCLLPGTKDGGGKTNEKSSIFHSTSCHHEKSQLITRGLG